MRNFDDFFQDLTDMTNKALTYTHKPMSDEDYQIYCIKDIIDWADDIASEWSGDESGSEENRAHQATEIMEKAYELQLLIEGMKEL